MISMKSIAIAALVLLVVATGALGAPVKFTAKDCGGSSTIGLMESFSTLPSRLHTGKMFKVTNKLNLKSSVLGGVFQVTVTALGGIPLKHAHGQACGRDTSFGVYIGLVKVASVTYYGLPCPLAAGPVDVIYDIQLSPILPPMFGSASFKITAQDQSGADLMCVQAHLGVNLENGAGSGQNFVPALPTVEDPPAQVDMLASTSHSAVAGAPVKFTAKDCRGSSTTAHLKSFSSVPARPHTGEVFQVTNSMSLDSGVSGGQFEVTVTALGGVTLKHERGPVCGQDTSFDVYIGLVKVASVTYYGLSCPLAAGPVDVHYDIKLSTILPPMLGSASFKIASKDQSGADLMCVQAHLGINLESDTTKNESLVIV